MPQTFVKDPNAVLDYTWDWAGSTNSTEGADSDWLASGETISTATVTADAGLTVASSSIVSGTAASSKVTAWLTGGTAGASYNVLCRITTNANRTDDRTIYVNVRNL